MWELLIWITGNSQCTTIYASVYTRKLVITVVQVKQSMQTWITCLGIPPYIELRRNVCIQKPMFLAKNGINEIASWLLEMRLLEEGDNPT